MNPEGSQVYRNDYVPKLCESEGVEFGFFITFL